MPSYPGSIRQYTGPYQMIGLPFNQSNIADANGIMESWEGANTLTPPMPVAGFVYAISLYTNADLTTGSILFNPGVNTVADTSLGATLDGDIQEAYAVCAPGSVPFVAGDNLSVIYTKTGTVDPVTSDVLGMLWVVLNFGTT
jgi:hypothetical protein